MARCPLAGPRWRSAAARLRRTRLGNVTKGSTMVTARLRDVHSQRSPTKNPMKCNKYLVPIASACAGFSELPAAEQCEIICCELWTQQSHLKWSPVRRIRGHSSAGGPCVLQTNCDSRRRADVAPPVRWSPCANAATTLVCGPQNLSRLERWS